MTLPVFQNMYTLNRPGAECQPDTSEDDVDMEACHQEYLERELGCALPWRDHVTTLLQTCSTEGQFEALLDLYQQLRDKDEQKIYEQTGCLQGSL